MKSSHDDSTMVENVLGAVFAICVMFLFLLIVIRDLIEDGLIALGLMKPRPQPKVDGSWKLF